MKLFLCSFLLIACSKPAFSQFGIKDSCTDFTLKIEAENLQSDSIRLSYNDCEDINYKDIFVLSNGKVNIRGAINRAAEGILYTNIGSRLMDGPRVIRFIIEPKNMTLHFTILKDTVRNVVIRGSGSQREKEAWENDNAPLLQARESYRNKIIQSIHQKDKKNDPVSDKKLQVMNNKFDALQELLITEVLRYAKGHPYSYFSAYLLNHYKRHITTDTLETYFSNLDSKVINSDFGKNILDELFKLTDDWAFRKKFTDSVTYESLKKIKNIYDVSLPDAEGTETSFSKFKGNVLLIDFWASWCKPCVRNVPGLRKLNTEIKDKPFKIISVSIDRDRNIWLRAIKKYGFPGIHLFDDKGFLSTFYKVLWVPRCVIVKPDGTVANMDAPQANDPKLKVQIEDLLKEVSGNALR